MRNHGKTKEENMAVHFVPAADVTHMENSGRQLEFQQANNGKVVVKVRYGLSNINTVYQNNVFVDTGPLDPLVALNDLNRKSRKRVIEIIERNDQFSIATVNGPLSKVESRQFAGKYSTVTDIVVSI